MVDIFILGVFIIFVFVIMYLLIKIIKVKYIFWGFLEFIYDKYWLLGYLLYVSML